jgi:hypothetical protein
MAKRAAPGSRKVVRRIARTIAHLSDREAALVYGVSERTVRQWREIAAGRKPARAFPGFRSKRALAVWDEKSLQVYRSQREARRAVKELKERRKRERELRQVGVEAPPPTGEEIPGEVLQEQTDEVAEVSEEWEKEMLARVLKEGAVTIRVDGVDLLLTTVPVVGVVRARGRLGDVVRAFKKILVPDYFVVVVRPSGHCELIDTSRKPKKGRRGKRGA